MEELDDTAIRYREYNRVCGDDIEVFLLIEGDIIKKWSFTGQASMITIACS